MARLNAYEAVALTVGLVAFVACAWFGLAWRLRAPEDKFGMCMLRTFNWLYCRLWFRLKLPCRDPFPSSGPFLLVSNHACAADPFLLTACGERVVSFMVAEEFFRLIGVRWIFRAVDAIAVTRSGQDLAATRAALRALKQGRAVGLFPEGKIGPPEGPMLPGRLGAALLALRAGVPVIPAYIHGPPRSRDVARTFLLGGSKGIRFGQPILPADLPPGTDHRHRLEAATALFMRRIAELDPTGFESR